MESSGDNLLKSQKILFSHRPKVAGSACLIWSRINSCRALENERLAKAKIACCLEAKRARRNAQFLVRTHQAWPAANPDFVQLWTGQVTFRGRNVVRYLAWDKIGR